MSATDWKAPPKVRDATVYSRFHGQPDLRCLGCGGSNRINAAHLLRGSDREDVFEALIPLCGSGASGCHGAFDSGHAWTDSNGVRHTPRSVKAKVARYIRSEVGADNAAYLISRLGEWGAENYVLRLEGRLRPV